MSKTRAMSMAAALIAFGTISFTSPASATPLSNAFAIKNAAPNNLETVQWRGGGWRRGGWGYYGGGFAAGAIIGGALAAPYYYGYGPYPGPYYPAPAYYGAPYGAAHRGPGCIQSPASMSYTSCD